MSIYASTARYFLIQFIFMLIYFFVQPLVDVSSVLIFDLVFATIFHFNAFLRTLFLVEMNLWSKIYHGAAILVLYFAYFFGGYSDWIEIVLLILSTMATLLVLYYSIYGFFPTRLRRSVIFSFAGVDKSDRAKTDATDNNRQQAEIDRLKRQDESGGA